MCLSATLLLPFPALNNPAPQAARQMCRWGQNKDSQRTRSHLPVLGGAAIDAAVLPHAEVTVLVPAAISNQGVAGECGWVLVGVSGEGRVRSGYLVDMQPGTTCVVGVNSSRVRVQWRVVAAGLVKWLCCDGAWHRQGTAVTADAPPVYALLVAGGDHAARGQKDTLALSRK
jgi:hypothetical protein